MAKGSQTQQLTQAVAKRLAMSAAGTGCGCYGCVPGCGCLGAVLLGLVIFLAITYYACNEFLGGSLAWVDSLAAKIGLSPGICALFK